MILTRKIAGFIGILGILLTMPTSGPGQVIENPAKPKAADAGRVVSPAEILAISDEGTSDYYFKWGPSGLTTAPDGSLFLRDEEQTLMFDAGGRFLRNLFKKGQGPGEMLYAGTAAATERNIVVYSSYPSKLVYFDRTGRYEKEIAVRTEGGRRMMSLIGHQAGRFYFESGEFPRTTGDPDIVDNPRTIVVLNEADGTIRSLTPFVTKAWVVSAPGGGGGMFSITSLIAVPFDGDLLALTHTEEYLIRLFDPAANKVIREFRRAYPRIKGEPLTESEKKGGIIINDKRYTRPERKFENDVKNILARTDEIWAVTSTKDKDKGIFVDVFDGEGSYRDTFWLKLPEPALASLCAPGRCAIHGDVLWVVERSEDEAFAIKKYRIPAAR